MGHVRARQIQRNGDAYPVLRANVSALHQLTPGLVARAQAYLFAVGALTGALGVILPHPENFNEIGMLLVQLASVLAAAVLLFSRGRLPPWALTIGPFAGMILTSLVLMFSGSSTSPYLLFYMWIALYAFYVMPRTQAALLAGFAILNYAGVVLAYRVLGDGSSGSPANEDIPAMVLMVGTVMISGAFIVVLRERVGRLISQLTEAATTDPLTGLLSRRGFHRALEVELARSQPAGRGFSVVMGDCDLFKQLNDRLGHRAGDDALLAVGRLLRRGTRAIDVTARIGGEEFALILPETDQHEAYLLAEALRIEIASAFENHPVPLTMSFGVSTYPMHASTVDEILRAADDALHAAKALGRDRSVLYSEEIEGILTVGRDGAYAREQAQLITVLNLAEALDMRDTGTARHSQTVGRYCDLMAREMGLTRDRVNRLGVAGVLHDIGKIGVADSILRKPGPLTDDEYDAMKKHPEIGARILGGSGLDDIREWILAHHERPDGRGYPFGLAGDEIPLEARILAVADAYEAMTSDRVYRRALGADAARKELRAGAGKQFDGAVVTAFLRALRPDEEKAGLAAKGATRSTEARPGV